MRPSRQRPTSLTHGIKPTPRSTLNTRKSPPPPYTTSSLPSLRVTQLQTLFRMNRLTLQDFPDRGTSRTLLHLSPTVSRRIFPSQFGTLSPTTEKFQEYR